ncbi:MAG TPA: TonB-dependent receptor [Xanthomonadaceae bacterium]|nr:TonB-dependent receptor [Xanthomonadaceae bacterium]
MIALQKAVSQITVPQKSITPRRRVLATWIVALVPLSAAHAQAIVDQPAVNQPAVIVTGVRHAQTVDDSLASVTVIDRSAIEKSPEVDLISLLAQQAGVDVSRTGGAGQSSTVFLRGANSNQTLILIDGIRVASATNSVFDFANLPLDQIERIEIVRGPRAAFWGSDAIGGVIQIFTRKPDALSVRAEVGSYGLRGGEVSFGTPANSDSYLGVTAGDERQRGFSATNPSSCSGPNDPFCAFNPDNDGYRNRHASVRGSTPLGTQTLGIAAIYTNGNVMFDSGLTVGRDPTSSNARNTSGGATLSGPLAVHWSQSLTIGGADNDITTPVFGSETSSHRASLDWVNTLDAIAGGIFTFGGNWQHESGTSISGFSVLPGGIEYAKTQTNAAGFVGYDATFGSQQIELALRHDHNSQFGGATTGTVAWGFKLNDETRLRASWGQGFRAPSFDELYSPGFGTPPFAFFAGNSALQPERSQSVEAGLEFKPSTANTFNLSAWRTRVSNLIAFDGPNFDAVNISRAALDGIELSYRYNSGPWSAGASATVQNPRTEDTGEQLLRRPKRKLAADLRYDFGYGLDLSVDGLAASVRKDFPNGNFDGDLHPYALLNLAAGWNFHPGWRLEARLGNLFDEHYELAHGYNTPGRNGQLTVTWQPRP